MDVYIYIYIFIYYGCVYIYTYKSCVMKYRLNELGLDGTDDGCCVIDFV